VKFLIKVRSKR